MIMSKKFPKAAEKVMNERFHKDALICLATVDETGKPWARGVNAYYEDHAFYIITDARSQKMKQIQENDLVAVSGDWFSGHGIAENLGHVLLEEHQELMGKLREAMSCWYEHGHVDEQDPNTVILCIWMMDGILYADGKRYEIDFRIF